MTVIGIGFGLSFAVGAEKSQELTVVQSKIQQVDADIKNLASVKAAGLEQLRKLEKQYGELINLLMDIRAQIKQQEDSLKIVRTKVALTKKNIQLQQQSLAGLIKSVYAMGGQKGLKLILNQHDPGLSGRMLVYNDYIGRAHLQKLLAIQADLKTLQELEVQKDTESQQLQLTLEKKKQETEALQTLKNQRENLLAQLENDFRSKTEQKDELIRDERKLVALLASLQKTDDNALREPAVMPSLAPSSRQTPQAPTVSESSGKQSNSSQEQPKKQSVTDKLVSPGKAFVEQQGRLPWPVEGTIIEHFGHPRSETTWDGTVISARESAEIHAVAPGVVIYADWLRGYGLMLILDHGKGYMSLYAFNQSLNKSVGEQVNAGDSVATVGRSGGRSQAALYFGIRKNGRPVNPEQWFRK